MRRDHATLFGTLFALTAASMFAWLGPLSRFAAEMGIGAIAFVAWRAGIGALALAVPIVLTGGGPASLAALRGLDRRDRTSLAIATAMGLTLNLAIFIAFGRITIALALMLFYTYPAMVAAVAMLTGHERLTPWRGAALGIASGGVVLVLLGGLDASAGVQIDLLGVLLSLAAAASQTVFFTVSRHGYSSVPTETATLVILVVSAVGAVVTALLSGLLPDLVVPFHAPGAWPIILVAGILAAGVPAVLFLTAIRRIGGTRTGILMLWEPVVAVMLSAVLLGERLVPMQVAGGVLVLTAALILQLASDPDEEPIAGAIDIV
jgi:drug/metabolite transporter (DMT)-like permease